MCIGTHRARSVQGQHGDDVIEAGWSHETQQGSHGRAIELEDAQCVASGQHLVGVLVIKGKILEIDVDPPVLLDDLDTVIHDAEVSQAQEVHLHEPHLLELGVGEAGDDHAVLVSPVHRHQVEQRSAGQDEGTCVHTGTADQSLETLRRLDNLSDVRIVGNQLAELLALAIPLVGRIEDLAQRHSLAHNVRGHGLGDLVSKGEGIAENTISVLDGSLGLDLAEGVDLAGVLRPVLVGDVIDDLVTLTIVEVEVDVGRVDAFRVEEPLEQQSVFQRIDGDDARQIGDEGTGSRSTTRPDRHAHGARRIAYVGDDEEVGGESQRLNDREFRLETVEDLLRRIRTELLIHALLKLLTKPGLLRLPFRDVELRHPVDVIEDLVVGPDHLGQQQGVVAGLGMIREQRPHLVRGLDVVARTIEAEAVRIILVTPHTDAQQGVMGVSLVLGDVVRVIGDQQRNVQPLGQPQQVGSHLLLDRDTMVHQLAEVVLLAEDVLVGGRGLAGFLELPQTQSGLHLTRRTSGGGNDATGVLGHQFAVHAGLHVIALVRGQGGQPEQVVKPLRVLGPHRHVGVPTTSGDVLATLGVRITCVTGGSPEFLDPGHTSTRGDIGLDTDDRFDQRILVSVVLLGDLEELVGTEHVAVVGHGDRRHALTSHLGKKLLVAGSTIQHRVLSVSVKVDEVGSGHGQSFHEPTGMAVTPALGDADSDRLVRTTDRSDPTTHVGRRTTKSTCIPPANWGTRSVYGPAISPTLTKSPSSLSSCTMR